METDGLPVAGVMVQVRTEWRQYRWENIRVCE